MPNVPEADLQYAARGYPPKTYQPRSRLLPATEPLAAALPPVTVADRIVATIRSQGPLTYPNLYAILTDVDRQTIQNELTQLVLDGKLGRTGSRGKYRYNVP